MQRSSDGGALSIRPRRRASAGTTNALVKLDIVICKTFIVCFLDVQYRHQWQQSTPYSTCRSDSKIRQGRVNNIDTVSERLRRWTRNPLGSARRGSNPLGVACGWFRRVGRCSLSLAAYLLPTLHGWSSSVRATLCRARLRAALTTCPHTVR